jgi:hypothetical protein
MTLWMYVIFILEDAKCLYLMLSHFHEEANDVWVRLFKNASGIWAS